MKTRTWIQGLCLLLLFLGTAAGRDPAVYLESGRSREGKGIYKVAREKYAKAIEGLVKIVKEDPEDREALAELAEARLGVLRTAAITGDEAEALLQADAVLAGLFAEPAKMDASVRKGRILFSLGKLDEAEKVFSALAAKNKNHLWSLLYLGRIQNERGRRKEAFETFDRFTEIWTMEEYEETADNLMVIALGAIELIPKYSRMALDAQRILEKVLTMDPGKHEASVTLGNLFLSMHSRDRKSFQDVIKQNKYYPDAHVGLATYYLSKYQSKEAQDEVRRALAVNPRHVEGLLVQAKIDLGDQMYDKAMAAVKKALEVNPRHLTALSIQGAIQYMQGKTDEYEASEKKILSLNPSYGMFYHIMANLVQGRRRLEEAVNFERKAVKVNPELWIAHIDLGIALSRQGKVKEAKKALEAGTKGDTFHVQARNLLTLFDDYDEFIRRSSPHFNMLFHKNDAEVMNHYTAKVLERGWKEMTARYKFEPMTPVMVEMFRQQRDFAVRTIGLDTLGALGACFGPLITLDSPRALPPGRFNWASTTWHEFAHVVTVQLSDGRVPRWFTEGLSVYEERRGKPTWVRPAFREFYGRVLANRLTPLEKLNPEFTRGRVLFAYFHASWIVEFIVDAFGFDKIIAMLKEYGKDRNDVQVIQSVLGLSMAEMNRRFLAWCRKRFGHFKITPLYYGEEIEELRLHTVENPKDAAGFQRLARACFQNGKQADAEINAGRALGLDESQAGPYGLLGEIFYVKKRFETAEKYLRQALEKGIQNYTVHLYLAHIHNNRGERDLAIEQFELARAAFPEYVNPDGPYIQLARLYEMAGDKAKAIAMTEEYVRRMESILPPRLILAKHYMDSKQDKKLIDMCRQILDVWPYRLNPKAFGRFDTHFELASALLRENQPQEALDEGRLALVEAQFGDFQAEGREEINIRLVIAKAAMGVGKKDVARRELEEIIEVLDPEDKTAQELLKKLQGK